MGWKPQNTPSFFKLLLHPDHFLDYLPIPPCFVTKYLEGWKMKHNAMLVTNESLKQWPVTLVDISGRYYFKLGWPEFVRNNTLETGDFLLFWLIHDSTFRVSIYGPSGIEKKNNTSSATNSGKFKKAWVDNEWACMHQAATFVKPVHNPFFKVTINSSSMAHLYLPKPFVRETGLLSSRRSTTLRDITGKEWPVKISRHMPTYGYRLTSGWGNFRKANELKNGDTCLFQFLLSEGNVIHFEVLNRKGSKRLKEGKSKKVIVERERGCMHRAATILKPVHNPFFKVTIKNNSRCDQYLPKGFVRETRLLSSARSTTLRDVEGREWPVKIYQSNSTNQHFLGLGWVSFRKANEIKNGDTCLFQFLRSEGNVIQFEILNRKGSKRQKQGHDDDKSGKVKEGGHGGCSITEAASVKGLQQPIFFKALLGRSCKTQMGLPIWFARESGLAKCRAVIMKDATGHEYPVKIRPRNNNLGYDLMTGWNNLRVANNMEKGDTCLFWFFREECNVIHVKVIQKKVKKVTKNKGENNSTSS